MRDRPQVAERFLRALVRGARDAQDAYNKNPEIAALLAKASKLDLAAIEACNAFFFDRDLDIAKYVDSLRRQETVYQARTAGWTTILRIDISARSCRCQLRSQGRGEPPLMDRRGCLEDASLTAIASALRRT